MRRKNLIFTSAIILLLVMLHGYGMDLNLSSIEKQIMHAEASCFKLEGKVTEIHKTDTGQLKLKVRIRSIDGIQLKRSEKILVRCTSEGYQPWELYRRDISFEGPLELPEGRRNPGCFDYRLYLKSQNVFYQSSAESIAADESNSSIAETMVRWLIKQRFLFMDTLGKDARGLVSGILFGDTSLLEEDVFEDFQNNGTAHVLAVSGLHVGILYAMYKKVFGSRQTFWSVLFLTVLLFCYGTLSMWSASMCRASMMIGLHELARLLDLRYDMTTGLSTVALVFILVNPYSIFSAGFQMSFLAIASICFLTRILPKWIPDSMTAGIAVNMGLLFYQVFQFNYVSFVSIFVNIPIIYLTGILVPVSLLCFGVHALTGGLPSVLSFLLDSLSFFTVKVNHFSALGGYGSMDVVSPPLWMVFCVYFLLFFLSSEQNLVLLHRRNWRMLASILTCGILCCILISTLFYSPVSDSDVVFVDVGQGDCIHIRDGLRNMLIDGGGSRNYNIGKNTLKPYLLKNGVWNIDLALATHTHMDHYKGLQELAEVYPVEDIKTGMAAGNNVIISEKVWVETLWPLEIDPMEGQEENKNCSVFMVHYKNWKIMITGDLDETGERELIAYYQNHGMLERLDADVLKVGHHGSAGSTCDAFLDVVTPQAAVIQVGKNNTYGHPSQIIVEKCQKQDIILVRNDYNGGIGFSFQEDCFRIDTVM